MILAACMAQRFVLILQMHNPLALLDPSLLEALIAAGHSSFVRQSYPRGGKASQEALLITPYRSPDEAFAHYEAIPADHRRHMYRVEDTVDVDKLYIAAAQPTGFLVYIALLKEEDWDPDPVLKAKVKRWVGIHTNRRPGRKNELEAALCLQFGELFITLKYRDKEMPIPLSDIEKI